jgi:hypothetical protein
MILLSNEDCQRKPQHPAVYHNVHLFHLFDWERGYSLYGSARFCVDRECSSYPPRQLHFLAYSRCSADAQPPVKHRGKPESFYISHPPFHG